MNATWHHLWGAVDDDGRLDRCSTVVFTRVANTVYMTSPGNTIRWVPGRSSYGTPPEVITDGAGGPSPQSVAIPEEWGTIYLVAVAFDPAGLLERSVPAQAEFTRP